MQFATKSWSRNNSHLGGYLVATFASVLLGVLLIILLFAIVWGPYIGGELARGRGCGAAGVEIGEQQI
jgi:hypothetical protein